MPIDNVVNEIVVPLLPVITTEEYLAASFPEITQSALVNRVQGANNSVLNAISFNGTQKLRLVADLGLVFVSGSNFHAWKFANALASNLTAVVYFSEDFASTTALERLNSSFDSFRSTVQLSDNSGLPVWDYYIARNTGASAARGKVAKIVGSTNGIEELTTVTATTDQAFGLAWSDLHGNSTIASGQLGYYLRAGPYLGFGFAGSINTQTFFTAAGDLTASSGSAVVGFNVAASTGATFATAAVLNLDFQF